MPLDAFIPGPCPPYDKGSTLDPVINRYTVLPDSSTLGLRTYLVTTDVVACPNCILDGGILLVTWEVHPILPLLVSRIGLLGVSNGLYTKSTVIVLASANLRWNRSTANCLNLHISSKANGIENFSIVIPILAANTGAYMMTLRTVASLSFWAASTSCPTDSTSELYPDVTTIAVGTFGLSSSKVMFLPSPSNLTVKASSNSPNLDGSKSYMGNSTTMSPAPVTNQ